MDAGMRGISLDNPAPVSARDSVVSGLSLSSLQRQLLDRWQRDFPLETRPFECIARSLGIDSGQVLAEFSSLLDAGLVSRIGPVFRPNAIGASTLAAASVPVERLEATARIVNGFDAVNHNYARDHAINLWFVATAESATALREALDDIERAVGVELLRLPLERDYHIDLGFPLFDERRARHDSRTGHVASEQAQSLPMPGAVRRDVALPANLRELVASIQDGLALCERPYLAVARTLQCSERQVIDSLALLIECNVIRRFGVVVRHRRLGFRANAMVVWNVPDERVDALGAALGAEPDVTLCYRRPRVAGRWPYNLFCMIHGGDRVAVHATVERLAERHAASDLPRAVLFSTRCFRQRGARYRQAGIDTAAVLSGSRA